MGDDLRARLRERAQDSYEMEAPTFAQCADRISALEAERDALRAALSRSVSCMNDLIANVSDPGTEALACVWCAKQLLDEIARATLTPKEPPHD